MADERENYGSGSSTQYGYIAEWRLRPDSAAIAAVLHFQDVHAEWQRAGYSVSRMLASKGMADLVKPEIHEFDEAIAAHGLVREDVAEAIVACLKTKTREAIRQHIEWRVVCVCLKETHEMTRVDKQRAEGQEMVRDIVKAVLD